MGSEDLSVGGCQATPTHVIRDLETIDAELRLLAAVRRVCREHAGVLPAIGPVDELLDERGELAARPPATRQQRQQSRGPMGANRKAQLGQCHGLALQARYAQPPASDEGRFHGT